MATPDAPTHGRLRALRVLGVVGLALVATAALALVLLVGASAGTGPSAVQPTELPTVGEAPPQVVAEHDACRCSLRGPC
jgi:hypothetical protein